MIEVSETREQEKKRSELWEPTIHYVHPEHRDRAWCGAPVLGIYSRSGGMNCVVCADLRRARDD